MTRDLATWLPMLLGAGAIFVTYFAAVEVFTSGTHGQPDMHEKMVINATIG